MMDYQWIFFFLIDLMLCSNIKLLRINTIILFNIFQHVTKKQNLNQNWYCKLWCHWQKSKHWNGWKGSRFSLSWTISNQNFYYSIKTNYDEWFCRKSFLPIMLILETEFGWNYISCQLCKRKVKQQNNMFWCDTCKSESQFPMPRWANCSLLILYNY